MRSAGRQNNHPTFVTFKQLYHLISLYKALKPPKYGNCTVREEEGKAVTFGDFLKSFPKSNETHKKRFLNELKCKLDGLIETDDWDNAEAVVEELSDSTFSDVQDSVIYYITGFVSRKFFKESKCDVCKNSFASSYENLVVGCKQTDMVNIKSRGGLTHPNINLFSLFLKLEELFEKHRKKNNVYRDVINEFFQSQYAVSFPCENHKDDIIANLMHYYITSRMRHLSRIISREEIRKSQSQKKMGNLYNH